VESGVDTGVPWPPPDPPEPEASLIALVRRAAVESAVIVIGTWGAYGLNAGLHWLGLGWMLPQDGFLPGIPVWLQILGGSVLFFFVRVLLGVLRGFKSRDPLAAGAVGAAKTTTRHRSRRRRR
jgi:hypothetical protein